MRNYWKDGIFGVVAGDALGSPVQFEDRATVATHPVTCMRENSVFHLPAGSWTDDSSLTLALLDSICTTGRLDLDHIMGNFTEWLFHGAYTPFGFAFDIGRGTRQAIKAYRYKGPLQCGKSHDQNNGNGSLMRILPACLFCYQQMLSDDEAVQEIHAVGSLTHANIRANIACGLYYFMVKAILTEEGTLDESLQKGLDHGFTYYESQSIDHEDLEHYHRLRDLPRFSETPSEQIRSTGYVVDTLEAVVWSLITTNSLETALLKAVNLGVDSDTVGAIAGGLAGLFYGFDAIPSQWTELLKKRIWIEELCEKANQAFPSGSA